MSKTGIGRLGREVKISPKTHVWINEPGLRTEWPIETIEVLIGIGKNHNARLIMDTEAWEALKSGEEIHITTTREFIKK